MHTAELRRRLADRPGAPLISSTLARVEVLRSCRRLDERSAGDRSRRRRRTPPGPTRRRRSRPGGGTARHRSPQS
ncbi:hypothetical protein [Blastococcus saxobsidens]|uniref:hypothetical protein n=1 Tax=Blastococcus saxobsidens TaxID=138336 RepID=UPI003AFFA5EE